MKDTIVYIDLDTNTNKLGKVLATDTLANGVTLYKVIDHEAQAIIWIPDTLVLRAPRSIYEWGGFLITICIRHFDEFSNLIL